MAFLFRALLASSRGDFFFSLSARKATQKRIEMDRISTKKLYVIRWEWRSLFKVSSHFLALKAMKNISACLQIDYTENFRSKKAAQDRIWVFTKIKLLIKMPKILIKIHPFWMALGGISFRRLKNLSFIFFLDSIAKWHTNWVLNWFWWWFNLPYDEPSALPFKNSNLSSLFSVSTLRASRGKIC